MSLFEALILGVLQGITEFLPISSSGHLVLGQEFLGMEVELLKSFDVVVHIASLFAIFVYFRKDLLGMLKAFLNLFRGRVDREDPYGKLIIFIIIGTIPVGVIGFFGEEWIDAQFRSATGVASAMIVTGLVFIAGEFVYKFLRKSGARKINLISAIVIGLAQAAALIPGVSRSGATIAAGVFQGIERSAAARFSFLLAMPAIAGAGILTIAKDGNELVNNASGAVSLSALSLGFVASFIFSFISIWFLIGFFKRFSLNIFAVYLIVLGLWTFFS